MNIIVDAFGGDNAPLEILKGCAEAVAELSINITLVGDKKKIESIASDNNILLYRMDIVDTPDTINAEDDPTEILKSKKDSSMAVGLSLLKEGKGDAFVSAGSSGALVVGATFIVKRLKGIKRVAFAPILPKDRGGVMLLDAGANVDCRPEMLAQFGVMGSIYMNKVMNILEPRVGLVNVGVENNKGTSLQKEAFQKLKELDINFVGNIEAREIPADIADVVVCDGFTGNIILKLFEGVGLTLMKKIKKVFTKNLKNKVASAIMVKEINQLKKEVDYNEYGGAPILGLAKPVFKAHGSSTAKTFKNAIKLTVDYVNAKVQEEISLALENTQPDLDGEIA